MAEFTLHCFAESGNAYKVALMMELSRADWEPERVEFFKGVTRGAEFRAMNTTAKSAISSSRSRASFFSISPGFLAGSALPTRWRSMKSCGGSFSTITN